MKRLNDQLIICLDHGYTDAVDELLIKLQKARSGSRNPLWRNGLQVRVFKIAVFIATLAV